jgi:hypothetical protein
MANAKKRPNKKAKAAQKILENSKLLDTSKNLIDSKADQSFTPTESAVKTATAHKIRPNKKRG